MSEKRFRRKEVKQKEKKTLLPTFMSEEQIELLKDYIKRGAVFTATGSVHAPKREVLRGLTQEMKSPTFNGFACYDARVAIKEATERPFIILTLNDFGNKNILHSIREVKGEKIYFRYRYKDPKEQ